MTTENPLKNLSRRNFLKLSAVWTGGVYLVGVPAKPNNTYRVLTEKEAAIMDELADCIIPPDDFAGGKEAKVTRFIDLQISSEGYLQNDREMYKTCLMALETECINDYSVVFTDLTYEMQVKYLTQIEAGDYNSRKSRDWESFIPSGFFGTMRSHCMMGYYGSPKHGGNKDYVSYQMLGLSTY